MSRLEELADRLDEIVAELDELSLAVLHEALADGATARPVSDRELTRVRRSVEKASGLLRRLDAGDGDSFSRG
jgi:hypothetical protein